MELEGVQKMRPVDPVLSCLNLIYILHPIYFSTPHLRVGLPNCLFH
jgi:hypothetical protein